ncbi:MAG: glutamate formimidoyltransferase [Candidatus Izemoplasmatales bacterium]
MKRIVECVPNISEGKDHAKIKRITDVFSSFEGIKVLSVEPDGDYNRTVITLLGDPEEIISSMLPFTKKVLEEIDMNQHHGEHPRMGAIDVIPFIPVEGVTMKDCVSFAERVGEMLANEFSIPVFLYAEAARTEQRTLLPDIRKGEFEGMKDKIQDPAWAPDFGPSRIHPTFGVTAAGAREFLVAFNIDLPTLDETPAKEIAKAIRKSSGGFAYIQAGPALLQEKGHVQVTMNILSYRKNPMYRILETVRMEAKRFHLSVSSAEVIGMIPKRALLESIQYYLECDKLPFDKNMTISELTILSRQHLGLRDFDESKIIESYL